jgi:hypothetical protein
LFCVVTLSSCLTYYQRHIQFNREFESGKFIEAEKTLLADKKGEKRKTRLLHYLNLGTVTSLSGKTNESNQYFENAYLLIEDHQKNVVDEALALLTNPKMKEYKGEDFESLLLHYYKAINFLKVNDKASALVEVRRMNNKLNALEDKYSNPNKYSKDAFVQTLMGIVYDALGEYNNAYIAYKNAYNTYKDVYAKQFGINAPLQLKKDLLRACFRMGFYDELTFFEKETGLKHQVDKSDGTELVMFWNNGLGPVKDEWSINFQVLPGVGGQVVFVNDELGLSFPFFLPPTNNNNGQGASITDLRFLRVAFPKYVERKTVYDQAYVELNGQKYPLELAENVNDIAFKSLHDRMLRELGNSLLRLAIKKFEETQIRKDNEGLATAVSIFNAISEQADTRNWQSLPHSIYYTRVPISDTVKTVKMNLISTVDGQVNKSYEVKVDAVKGSTFFSSFYSLEHINPPSMQQY